MTNFKNRHYNINSKQKIIINNGEIKEEDARDDDSRSEKVTLSTDLDLLMQGVQTPDEAYRRRVSVPSSSQAAPRLQADGAGPSKTR